MIGLENLDRFELQTFCYAYLDSEMKNLDIALTKTGRTKQSQQRLITASHYVCDTIRTLVSKWSDQ